MRAFLWGAQNGINPYAVAGWLVFIFVLARSCRTPKEITAFGIVFVLTTVMMTVVSVMGAYDAWTSHPLITAIVRGAYAMAGVVFMGISAALLYARGKARRQFHGHYLLRTFPVFFQEGEAERQVIRLSRWLPFSAVFWAALTTFCGLFWPQPYFLFVQFYALFSKGNTGLAVGTLILYSIGFVVPLLVVLETILIALRVKAWRGWCVAHAEFLKLVCAAIFMGTGIGLVYLCLT